MTNLEPNKVERRYSSSEVRFYTIDQLKEMLGWSESTVQKLFNDPLFPSSDYRPGTFPFRRPCGA